MLAASASAATRTVKVLIAKYTDDAGYPFTPAQIQDAVFGPSPHNANGFLQAITAGGTSLADAGIQQVELDYAKTAISECNDLISLTRDNAIDRSGIDPTAYNHVVVAATKAPSCALSGNGTIGQPGTINTSLGQGKVILNGNILWRLVSHELIHNLGANHAGACSPSFPAVACAGNTYGDVFDIMGASSGSLAGFPSSSTQDRLGLIGDGEFRSVTGDGVYQLRASNDTAASGVKLLAVPRAGGGAEPFTLETRIRRPYDDFLASGARLYNGVTVRLFTGAGGVDTQLVPAHPAADAHDWPLLACETFTDAAAGVRIRPLSVGGGQATVQVALGGRPLPAAPACSGAPDGPGGDGPGGDSGRPGGDQPAAKGRLVLRAKQVRPAAKKRIPVGSKVVLRARVQNRSGTRRKVRICLTAPKRLAVVKGKRCRVRAVRPGKAARANFRVVPSRRAVGRRLKLRIKAKAKGLKAARTRLKVGPVRARR